MNLLEELTVETAYRDGSDCRDTLFVAALFGRLLVFRDAFRVIAGRILRIFADERIARLQVRGAHRIYGPHPVYVPATGGFRAPFFIIYMGNHALASGGDRAVQK